jgi:glycosyltransferase involved in cell wall biosynthesis
MNGLVRILLIGPLPPPMGGDTRHFATLVSDLTAHRGFDVRVIDTSRGTEHSNWISNIFVSLRTMARIALQLPHVDVVSYHASDRGMFLFGPVVVALCKIARRPSILRVFGGSFGDAYRSQSAVRKAVTRRTLLSCDVMLLQTKRAVRDVESSARAKIIWFSTYIESSVRTLGPQPGAAPAGGKRCSRLVFLGHLWRTKGIETLLESAALLPGDCTIDIYGPTDEYSPEQINARGAGRVQYRGLLSHEQVDQKLWEYDCLVLPTFHPGEGYPGVIAEAFAHELPVVTTHWLAIPEIVDEECGVLIEPQNTKAFVAAVAALHDDPQRWCRMKAAAGVRARQFDHAIWAREFESICESLVRH